MIQKDKLLDPNFPIVEEIVSYGSGREIVQKYDTADELVKMFQVYTELKSKDDEISKKLVGTLSRRVRALFNSVDILSRGGATAGAA
mmetsp:Transcript_38191/g.34107  ORF Transcript_38191/g.34107 Transcript_38191/m.34107 type:complete len:87 (+) Transcript_38191:95-355(+)